MTRCDACHLSYLLPLRRARFNAAPATHAAILTDSRTLELFVKTFELISFNEHTKLNAFSSLAEGLAWLGLAEHEQELQREIDRVGG